MNEVTTKMAEQTKLQQVTMKDPVKVEVGKRLAEYNCRKRQELAKAQESEPKLTSSQYYGARASVTIGALGVIGYCAYWSKKGDVTMVHRPKEGDISGSPRRSNSGP